MKQLRSLQVTVEIIDDPSSPMEIEELRENIEKHLQKYFKKKLTFVDVDDLEWGDPV